MLRKQITQSNRDLRITNEDDEIDPNNSQQDREE